MEKECKKCYLQGNQEVDFDEIRLLTQYIPYKIVRSIGQTECCIFEKKIIELEGTVVYFDIIGFTSIVVNYLTSQKDIADLSNTLSEFYSVITETIRGFDGSIYQFAGDSILISFEKQDDESPEANFKRAFTAMLRTLDLSDNYNSVSQESNGFVLKPKIGIGYGKYNQILLGNKDYFVTPVLVGNAVSAAIDCEGQCKSQKLVISPDSYELAKKCNLDNSFTKELDNFVFTEINDSFFDTIEYPDFFDIEQLYEKPFFYNRLSSFLNPVIRHQIENSFQGFSGEYKDVTCLMIRFDGEFVKQLKTQEIADILSLLDSIYILIINKSCKYGGYSMKPDFSDKGIVFPVIFGTPSAIENKEINAIRCSIEITKASKEIKEISAVNIGAVTGMVYSGEFGGILRKDYTTIGNSINFASRLMTSSIAKEKFSILMDERTKEAVKSICITEEITGISCKGYQQQQTAYRFISQIEKNNLFFNTKKCLGRENEKEKLSECFEKSLMNQIATVAITGDVGIGKSFLVESLFSEKREKNSELQVYQAICYQYEQATPYFCWQSLFKQILQIPDDLPGNITEILVRTFIMKYFPEKENLIPTICNVLGYNIEETPEIAELDAMSKQKIIFDFIENLVLLYGQKPLVLIFENLQWCDIISLNILEYIIQNNKNTKTLFVLISRDCQSTKDFISKNNIPLIELTTLSKEKSKELTTSLLNLKEPNSQITNKIVFSSEGNPFFIENIIGNLLETKTLIEDEDGFRHLSDNVTNVENIEIPSSIQNIILSRLDSLKFEEQIVCKTASAIGRTFYSDCLRLILPTGISDSTVDNALLQFEQHDIISKTNEQNKEYIFNHVITHDVIYETILDTTKKELNLMILSYLESKYKNELYSIIEKLEYHAIEAKNFEKVFIYSQQAAKKAEKQAAPTDAITHYRIAEHAWKKIDSEKNVNDLLLVKLYLAEQYRMIGNYPEAEKEFNSIILECKDKFIYSSALRGLGRSYQERGDFEKSIKTLELALSSIEKKVPQKLILVYLSIAKEVIVQIINVAIRKGNIPQSKNNEIKKRQTASDILCVLNKLYYFGLPEKIAWSSLVNFNITLRIKNEKEHLCLAYGDYADSLSSAGFNNLGALFFKKGLTLLEEVNNQKVESIFKARYAFYFLFYNQPEKSISLLEEACSYFKKIYEQWELMTAGGALAQNYFLVGEFEKSREAYLQTEELAKKLHSPMHVGWAYNKIPFIDYITGNTSADSAIKNLLYGISLSESVNDHMTLCIHYGHLTHIELKEQNYEAALKYAESVMKENFIYKINVPHVKISYVNVVEAVYYSLLNNAIPSNKKNFYKKMAKKALQKCSSLSKKYLLLQGPTLKAESMFYLINGNETEAKKSYLKAVDVLKNSPYKWEYENLVEYGKKNHYEK